MSSKDCKIIIIVVLLSTLTLSSHGIPSEIGSISALYAERNGRNNMEDFAVRIENVAGNGFYAVLDGHGGNYSADYGQHYLAKTFVNVIKSKQYVTGRNAEIDTERMLTDFTDQIEAHLIEAAAHGHHKSGTTCLMVVVEKKLLTVGNIGDSRGIMCNSKGKAIQISLDQKSFPPNLESKGGYFRLVTKGSLGDHDFKVKDPADVIILKPAIQTFKLSDHKPKFMILASNGLWDTVDSQKAVDYIKDRYLTEKDFGAKDLAKEAIKLGSEDNITIMVIVFKNGKSDVATTSGA